MLQLRDYQDATLEALRKGFAEGHRTQILYAPTGAGKTEMAIALLDATKKKLNKAAMVLDRIVLCNQTSTRLDKYRIDHGVMQSGHWRYRPYERIQVCSAQTLERRKDMPDLQLLIVDEAHQTRDQTVQFIKNNPNVKVIGLSATPFTKGLGNIYQNVISTVTTKNLVDNNVLVPLRVYIAKEIDMEGAKKVAGEWSQSETTTRGMKITGDIVAEWIKKTHEIFGAPKKTVVFCSGVEHGNDLARKFAEQGYNFVSISYRDKDEFKEDVIKDFSRPDTEIHGLIATDILTKGFDCSDVMIGISARPFSKSLSSHIQQMGRVMRGHEGKSFALWLDHSGNYLRFREDWEDVYSNGVHALDDGKEKTRKEPTKAEKEASKCPKCGALWTGGDTCHRCGHIKEKKNQVSSVAGELQELNGTMGGTSKQDFWYMMQYYKRYNGWSDGRMAHTYRDKFGVWPRGLDASRAIEPNQEVKKFVDKKLRSYITMIKKGGLQMMNKIKDQQ
jgi:superfamily II DNA or RNA helicase